LPPISSYFVIARTKSGSSSVADSCLMMLHVRSQCAAQICGQITGATPGGDTVTKYCPQTCKTRWREVVGTAGLYRSDGLQQLRCLYLVKRRLPITGKMLDSAALTSSAWCGNQVCSCFVVPLQSHRLERALGRALLAEVCGPALGGWVEISFQLLRKSSRFFRASPSVTLGKTPRERDFFASSLPIPHPPNTSAISINQR